MYVISKHEKKEGKINMRSSLMFKLKIIDVLTDRLGGKEAGLYGVQPTFHNTRFFFCIFPMNFAMATLGLKEMEKFL